VFCKIRKEKHARIFTDKTNKIATGDMTDKGMKEVVEHKK